jgi:DNA-binding MarR family transcriptional regulator
MPTTDDGPATFIQDFLGSAHIFSSSVKKILEERVLRDVVGDRLTFQQYKLLRLVAGTDGHSIGEVALFLGVSNAAASKGVDKLVRRRFLHRAEDKADRRATHLTLTDQGRRVIEAYEKMRNEKMTGIFEAFPESELHRAAELLDRLSASLVAHGENPGEVCLQCGIYFRDRCLVRQLAKRNCFYARHESHKGATGVHGNGADADRADERQLSTVDVKPPARRRSARGA